MSLCVERHQEEKNFQRFARNKLFLLQMCKIRFGLFIYFLKFSFIGRPSSGFLTQQKEKRIGSPWLAKLTWDPQSCWSGRHAINTIRVLSLEEGLHLHLFPRARLSPFSIPLGTECHHQSTLQIISPRPSPTWSLTHFTPSKFYLQGQTKKIFLVVKNITILNSNYHIQCSRCNNFLDCSITFGIEYVVNQIFGKCRKGFASNLNIPIYPSIL